MSLIKLVEILGSNRQYVSQVINETYHKSFPHLINEFRIKESQRRMLNQKEYGNLTINAIAESVGFKSYAPFIIAFKEVAGLTPSMYNKIIQQKLNIKF